MNTAAKKIVIAVTVAAISLLGVAAAPVQAKTTTANVWCC